MSQLFTLNAPSEQNVIPVSLNFVSENWLTQLPFCVICGNWQPISGSILVSVVGIGGDTSGFLGGSIITIFSTTFTFIMSVEVAFLLSFTVSLNVNVPIFFGLLKVGLTVFGFFKDTFVPFVCNHEYVFIVPSESLLCMPESVTLVEMAIVWSIPASAIGF